MSFERINRETEQDKPVPSPDLTNNNFPQTPAPDLTEPFSPMGKSPRQLVQRVQRQMQTGQKLSAQEMGWAFMHGGTYFHQQAGLYNRRIRHREETERQQAEAAKNNVDSSEGIMELLPQPDNKKEEERKKRQTPDPFSAGNVSVSGLTGAEAQLPEQEQQTAKVYGGGGDEEDRKRLTSAFVIYEKDVTADILTGLFGGYYANTLAKSSYVKSKSKVSFEIPFDKKANKTFVKDHKYGVFFGELKTYADENLSKVTISAFRDKSKVQITDPENPALNLELKGNLEFLSLSQKGEKTEFSVAKAEGKLAYTINRSTLASATGMPGFANVIKASNPALYEAIERGELFLDFVFAVSLELDMKGVWEIIEDLDAKKLKEKQKASHEEEREKQKKKEHDAKNDKDSKKTEKNKLDDDTRKKEKRLKKLEKNPTDVNAEERNRLKAEIDEQKLKSNDLKQDIDKLSDEVEDARKAATKEDKAAKKLNREVKQIDKRVKKKKIPSFKDKLKEKLTKERIEKITEKTIQKTGQLVEKLSKKVLGKAATQLLKKAVMTAAKMILRFIPVIGFLIMLWDIVSTLWDIGKALWDWFTDEDDEKKGGSGEGESSEGEATDGSGTAGQEGDGTGTGDGKGIGSGEGTGTTQGNGSGQAGTGTSQQTTNADTNAPGEVKTEPAAPTATAPEGEQKKPEEKKEEEERTNIPVVSSTTQKEGKTTDDFSNLQWFAPKSMANSTAIERVRLVGYHKGELFSTLPLFTFEYKQVNGLWAYYPKSNFTFIIGEKEYQVSTSYSVKKIIFE